MRTGGPPGDASRRDSPLSGLSVEELFARYRTTGDAAVVEELVLRYEPLVRSVARRYHARGEPLDDLVQVANVGLLKAIQRFDPERGFAFTSFATPTMLGELKRYFRDSGWAVHVPRGVKERALELATTSDKLSAQLGRSPSIAELADALGATQEQTLEALEAYHGRHASPLERGGEDDEDGSPSPASTIGVEDEGLERAEYMSVIARGVGALSDDDRRLLHLRFGEDLTQSEIAKRIGTSQMQVSRLLRAAIEKIRRISGELDPPAGAEPTDRTAGEERT
ncbi:MAG TPA: SigB/SigF/SigG family RNA polymerase sigma factor [Solirubrobacteraceae bacterium]|nr:SigB/SigF/SigG family RNA polymerase sigma factor [Solirubrobacteraceae bacterium]